MTRKEEKRLSRGDTPQEPLKRPFIRKYLLGLACKLSLTCFLVGMHASHPWHCLGRFWSRWAMKPHWRKWFPEGGLWGHITQSHFLSILCFLFHQDLERSRVLPTYVCQCGNCLVPCFLSSLGHLPLKLCSSTFLMS